MTPIQIPLTFGVKGRFRFEKYRGEECTYRGGWFDNLITDTGLELLGTGPTIIAACAVGSGTNAPANSDVTLQSYVGSSGSQARSPITSVSGSSPYYGSKTYTFTLPPGTATGNISEVGIAIATGSTAHLFSRALVLDGGGSPTTITVLADEQLNVTYELRCYAPASDNVQSVTIGGTSRTITTRACGVTDVSSWAVSIGSSVVGISEGSGNLSSGWYTGAIGAVTAAAPSGTKVAHASSSNVTYVGASHQRDMQVISPVSNPILAAAFSINTSYGLYQIGISPAVNVLTTQTLSFTFRLAWARM